MLLQWGLHSGDHAIYPDCRQEFRDTDFEAFKAGNWGAEKVYHYTPYLKWTDKFTILEDGDSCCECLGLDFNEVYMRALIHLINQFSRIRKKISKELV